MTVVHTSKELAKALKEDDEFICIEGQYKDVIVRIKATGKIAWAIAIISIGAAVTHILSAPATTTATGPVGGAISFTGIATMTASAISILGIPATTFAISLSVAAGGIGMLVSLKNRYKIIERDDKKIVIQKSNYIFNPLLISCL